MSKRKGFQVTVYFESELAENIVKFSDNNEMTLQDSIRFIVKNHFKNETLDEIEKLQIFNIKAFKFIASKLAHLELLTAIEKTNNKKEANKYESLLVDIKSFNQDQINEYIKESL